ncbi:MAG: outer membrane protein assembly factor BamC [Methylococcales bacterium]|nr:outer membrane protein assembly factor BamC [Methylococcales bacterium]
MRKSIGPLLLAIALCSCSGTDERYKDTAALERPPVIIHNKQTGEPRIVDDSTIHKKRYEDGLGSDVYLTTSVPAQLKIKQAYDDAWSTLGLALKQSDLEVTDREHDKGLYYVSYDPDHSFFSGKKNELIYVLTVEDDGEETTISSALGSSSEQTSKGRRDPTQDTGDTSSVDGAEKLLQLLYETLHDKLKEE